MGDNGDGGLPDRGRSGSITAQNGMIGNQQTTKEDTSRRSSMTGRTPILRTASHDRTPGVKMSQPSCDSPKTFNYGSPRAQRQTYEGLGMSISDSHTSPHQTSSSHTPISEQAFDLNCSRSAKRTAYERHTPEPPVTKATLSELDVPRIILNPKLRHDINYDPDLHFRPNLDGERGRRKNEKTQQYWATLRTQLQTFMTNPEQFITTIGKEDWCLPMTLGVIKEILETLVPPEDRSAVEDVLNVDMLMQQLMKGVADLDGLAQWLSKTLKRHCAPMRDEWVDDMVKQLSAGNRNRDIDMLAQGLQTLLGVLEAMKLDVANHQIRCLRPVLIQDTVEFEQTFFMKRISHNKIDVNTAYGWYQAIPNVAPESTTPSTAGLTKLFSGIVNAILPSQVSKPVPDTFTFDEDRLMKLRGEAFDAVHVEVCVELFRHLHTVEEALAHEQTKDVDSFPQYVSSRSSFSSSSDFDICGINTPIARHSLSAATLPKMSDFTRRIKKSTLARETGSFTKDMLTNTLIWIPSRKKRCASSTRSSRSSRSSSPRLSREFAMEHRSQVSKTTSLSLPTVEQEATLRTTIRAILEDIPVERGAIPSTRWHALAPAIALEVLRASPVPLGHLAAFETQFLLHINNTSSLHYCHAEAVISTAITKHVTEWSQKWANLTSVRLFEAVVASRIPPKLKLDLSSAKVDKEDSSRRVDGIARAIAQIGILHWRVWAPLVYCVDAETIARRRGSVVMEGM